jgi:hypothetical protein
LLCGHHLDLADTTYLAGAEVMEALLMLYVVLKYLLKWVSLI